MAPFHFLLSMAILQLTSAAPLAERDDDSSEECDLQMPKLPCRDLFWYEYDPIKCEYHGLMDLRKQSLKNVADVELVLFVGDDLKDDHGGSIQTIDESSSLMAQIGKGHGLRYRVNLPQQDPLPRLIKLALNGRTLCSDRSGKKVDAWNLVTLRNTLRVQTGEWKKIAGRKK